MTSLFCYFRKCLLMCVNGMGFRAIERIKGVDHTSIINWVKQVRERLPEAYEPDKSSSLPLAKTLNHTAIQQCRSYDISA